MNESKRDIVVAGHICLDINPGFRSEQRDLKSLFMPGTLNIIGKASVATGGAVANTGLALKRMGMDVALIGKIADDRFGGLIREVLAEYGVPDTLLCVDGEDTSYSVNLAPPGTDRIILHCPGCNDTLGPDEIDLEIVRNARLFHFGYPSLLENFYNDDGENLASLFESVHRTGVVTSLDTAYPDPTSPSGQVNWKAILQKTLPYVDVFVPSVEELFIMLKPDLYRVTAERLGLANVAREMPFEIIEELAEEALDLGVKLLLLKCGIRGMQFQSREVDLPGLTLDTAHWSGRQLWHAPFDAEVVNATGAGDCAVAGFLSALLRGEGPEMAIRIASIGGWRNIQTLDTASGLDDYEVLQRDAARDDIPIVPPAIPDDWRPGPRSGEWVGPADMTAG